MATQVQFRRGTSGQNDAFTGALAEITVDTTTSVIRVHDGINPGGVIGVGTTSTQTLSNKTLTNTVITGNLVPSANLIYNLGSVTGWYNLVYGKSVQAQYADLAENYTADAEYVAGTVVVFGGDFEVTISTVEHDSAVAGVISSNPAYLMNSVSGNIAVALTGRVPCLVQGPVQKGTVLTTSNIPGVATALDPIKFIPGCVVGKSLQVIENESVQTIEIAVGRF
jgi:hypothetical protein